MDSLSSTRNAFDSAVFNFHFGYLGLIAGGMNWSTNPPTNSRSMLYSLAFLFRTDANAADRHITLLLNNGRNVTPIAFPSVTQTASLDMEYLFTTNGNNYSSPDGLKHVISISPDIILLEGWTIDSSIENLQGGDQTRNFNASWKVWTYEQ